MLLNPCRELLVSLVHSFHCSCVGELLQLCISQCSRGYIEHHLLGNVQGSLYKSELKKRGYLFFLEFIQCHPQVFWKESHERNFQNLYAVIHHCPHNSRIVPYSYSTRFCSSCNIFDYCLLRLWRSLLLQLSCRSFSPEYWRNKPRDKSILLVSLDQKVRWWCMHQHA